MMDLGDDIEMLKRRKPLYATPTRPIFSPLLKLYCYNVSVLNIGLFQFSSQVSVTLVSVLFTPPLVNPIYQQLSR